ncbi:hypothetical protein [uncultured Gilliamella sp.]|uniref:hypothetical protein n=1 Tax=uncultured Gilliamella sp. TaxID=1193505 RepID=UPI0025F61FFE|nr:hypothetical protein [uncultured Gilliamella sp.]
MSGNPSRGCGSLVFIGRFPAFPVTNLRLVGFGRLPAINPSKKNISFRDSANKWGRVVYRR